MPAIAIPGSAVQRGAGEASARSRLLKNVNLEDAYSCATILAPQNGGVSAWGEIRGEDSGLRVVRGLQPGGLDSCLVRLPIVVGIDGGAVAVVQFQRGIGEWIGDAEGGERRTDAAHYYLRSAGPSAKNETADHDIVVGQDKPSSADVRQLGDRIRIQVVSFHQGNAGIIRGAADHGRVGTGVKRCDD